MSKAQTLADGSSLLDAQETIVIEAADDDDALRYRCPNGHNNWSPTNSHIWCQSCARQAEHDADIEAEHYEIRDEKTGDLIPWSAIDFRY
jgi:5-methylcytosine-specific restriction endonuclease McrA